MGITSATADITVGGRTLEMRPLTVRDIEVVDNWLRVKFMRAIREAADGDEQTLAVGMGEMLKISYYNAAGNKVLATVTGIAKIISITTAATYDEALDLIGEGTGMSSFHDAFFMLNSTNGKKAEKTKAPIAKQT